MPSDRTSTPPMDRSSGQPYQDKSEAPGCVPPPEEPAFDRTIADSIALARHHLAELRAFLNYFISAKIDAARVMIRNLIFLAVAGVIGLLAAAGLVITSVVLICQGIAEGLTALMGHAWLGNLCTGVLILGIIGLGLFIVTSRIAKVSNVKMMAKYAKLRQEQKDRFGRDVQAEAEAARVAGKA